MPANSEIKKLVRDRYAKIAARPVTSGCGCCTDEPDYVNIGESYSTIDGYHPAADLGLGCGLPTQSAGIRPGDTVVDLGSGAGNDAFIARTITGESGRVIGVDMTGEMIRKARDNNLKLGFENVEFRPGDIENLPVEDGTADVVISNCVLNLVPDKRKAFSEIYRILKPQGHFSVSDIVKEGMVPQSLLRSAEAYTGCIAGAIDLTEYQALLREAGFTVITVVNSRRIELPEGLIQTLLSPAELSEWNQQKYGFKSITITGNKM
jgi:arsenite methyltransferase